MRLLAAIAVVLSLCAFKIPIQIKDGKIVVGNPKPPNNGHRPAAVAPPPPVAPAGDPAAAGGVCNVEPSIGICYLFVGAKNTEAQHSRGNQMACQMLKGQFAKTGGCPTANRLGRCTVKAGTPETYTVIYYPRKLDATKAKEDCVSPGSTFHSGAAGTWQPG